MGKRRDLTGLKFNHLQVLYFNGYHSTPCGTNFPVYHCKCDCGNEIDVLGSSLTSSHTKSCGCLQRRYKTKDADMIGKKFGKLTVISRAPSHKIPSGSVYDMWHCRCDCGNTTISFGRNLRKSHNKSCGCERILKQAQGKWIPNAEIWTRGYFDKHGIVYEYQKTFPDLKGNRGKRYPLSYDFYLPALNVLLELNGLQHYVPIDWFGGEESFKIRSLYDKLKKDYALKNSFNFYVIDTDRISKTSLFKKLDKILNNDFEI